MRLITLSILLIFLGSGLAEGQSKEINSAGEKSLITENSFEEDTNIKIFPVPVTNNRFTITSDKAFTFVRLTNIIGQETTREKYNYPRNRAEISFSNVQKGIYLVTIEFEDKTRSVKKILIDSP
ncbi:MAG: T9SS type A sorting domain-containing protein [Bacteroidales bacterium]|nr:T9SS type A sorting domain-containing protein [Bacteroidales bacterium]